MVKRKTDFCIECRKGADYILQKKTITKVIKEKEYSFSITVAICAECGAEMDIPGLIDRNVQEIDDQYRTIEGIIGVDDIEHLMKLYKIGKAPLSLALGFGEVTIARYLAGQVPSREYSDICRMALSSPSYMKKLLVKNRKKMADAAYRKSMSAATQLENLFSVSEKMLSVISYVFESLKEITPLMLQKLLYFIQGIYQALYNQPVFPEDCEAWIHGPVYPTVYDLFKDFKYNPIDDARFSILDGTADTLTAEERGVIDLVLNTFGLYGGKVLERITHNETPWITARRGYGDTIPSNETVTKDSIQSYYKTINRKYGIGSEEGLNQYIRDMLRKAS